MNVSTLKEKEALGYVKRILEDYETDFSMGGIPNVARTKSGLSKKGAINKQLRNSPTQALELVVKEFNITSDKMSSKKELEIQEKSLAYLEEIKDLLSYSKKEADINVHKGYKDKVKAENVKEAEAERLDKLIETLQKSATTSQSEVINNYVTNNNGGVGGDGSDFMGGVDDKKGKKRKGKKRKGKGGILNKIKNLATSKGTVLKASGALAVVGVASSYLLDDREATTANLSEDVGSVGGATAGMMLGASLGSVVPVLGTIVGGVLGGIIGDYLGGEAGKGLYNSFTNNDSTTSYEKVMDDDSIVDTNFFSKDEIVNWKKLSQQNTEVLKKMIASEDFSKDDNAKLQKLIDLQIETQGKKLDLSSVSSDDLADKLGKSLAKEFRAEEKKKSLTSKTKGNHAKEVSAKIGGAGNGSGGESEGSVDDLNLSSEAVHKVSSKGDSGILQGRAKEVGAIIRHSESKGRYNISGDIGDGAGISFGAYQITEKSGGLKSFVKKLSKSKSPYANEAQKVLGNFKGSSYKGDRKRFNAWLKKVGGEQVAKEIQDKIYYNKYYTPAMKLAKKHGITETKAVTQIIDHTLNAGSGGARAMLRKARGTSSEDIAKARVAHYKTLGGYPKYKKSWEGRVKHIAKLSVGNGGGSDALLAGSGGSTDVANYNKNKPSTSASGDAEVLAQNNVGSRSPNMTDAKLDKIASILLSMSNKPSEKVAGVDDTVKTKAKVGHFSPINDRTIILASNEE